jgi:hypothetical protein
VTRASPGQIARNKDVICGLVFAFCGLGFIADSTALTFGTPMEMGPAFFPRIVGVLLLILAAVIVAKGVIGALAAQGDEPLTLALPPILYVFLALFLFCIALRPLGLIAASVLLVLVVGAAPKDRRWVEVAISALVLSIGAGFLFVYGLGLQAPLLPWG